MFLKKSLFVFALSLLATGFVAPSQVVVAPQSANENSHHCDFFPPNNLRFPILLNGSQMSEMDFNLILKVVQQTYAPIFLKYGFGPFKIENRWNDDTVNAFADVVSQNDFNGNPTQVRMIHMFGGLARDPLMTREGFVLVACHEIGHHLGGYPRYSDDTWASTEGEADYYSTTKCSRIIFGQLSTNLEYVQRAKIDFQVRIQCNASFTTDQNQQAICMRSLMGGLALARVLGTFSGTPNVDFSTPDKSVVAKTFEAHPQAQCRLDTYFQGAICQKSEWDRFGSGPGFGACEARYTTRGARPACWYKDPIPRS